jgi:pyrroloquinoline quinone biosynthesis protein D
MSAGHRPLADDSRPRIAPGFRLQWEPAQSAHVLLYPEGMLKLNQSAGEILGRCDGIRSVAGIVAELEQAFETTGIGDDVRAFVRMAADKRWIVWDDPTPSPADGPGA